MSETEPSNVIKEVSVKSDWDKRLGDWAQLDNQTETNLPTYSRLLSKEETIFILRQFRLCNRDTDGNRYIIKNKLSYNLLYGIETNSCSDRIFICGEKRSFSLTFFDKNKVPALHLDRPFRVSCCGLIPCCKQKIEIKDNSNKIIGEVKEKFNFCRLSLKLSSYQTELQILGPICETRLNYCLDDICFEITAKSHTKDKQNISCGHICKLSELISGGHIFRIEFSQQISPELKCLVIGAAILIDYFYFDNTFHEHKYQRMTMPSAPETIPPFPLIAHKNNDIENNTNTE